VKLYHLHESYTQLEEPPSATPAGFRPGPSKKAYHGLFLMPWVYDNIQVEGVWMDGIRSGFKPGLILSESVPPQGWFQWEGFRYTILPYHLNLALHGVVQLSHTEVPLFYAFLGGFDSIRGLADGVLWGNKALWLNAELRHLSGRFTYLDIQTVVFTDTGVAGFTWPHLSALGTTLGSHVTVGGGLRFIIPQVNRFIWRMDWAQNLHNPHICGVSMGFNHLFQPYRPLDTAL
jgi:hypothetical protein